MAFIQAAFKKTGRFSVKILEIITRLMIWLFAAVMLLLVLVQLLFWGGLVWLNSGYGQDTLQTLLGQQLEGTPTRIELNGFNYIVPTHIYLGRIRVYRGDQELVEARSVRLHVKAFPLSSREIKLSLTASDVIVFETKQSESSPTVSTSSFPFLLPVIDALPELPFDRAIIEKLSVGNLIIQGESDITLSPQINGRVDLFGGHILSVALIATEDGANTPDFIPRNIQLRGQYDTQEASVRISSLLVDAPLYGLSGRGNALFTEGEDWAFKVLGQMKTMPDIAPVTVDFTAKNIADFVSNLDIQSAYQKKNIRLKTSATVEGDVLTLYPVQLNIPSASMSGKVSVNMSNSMVNGTLSGKLSSIAPYQALIGNDHDISPLSFTLNFMPKAGVQAVTFKVSTSEYRHIPSGLAFQALALSGAATQEDVYIESLSAKDDKNGLFTASGHFYPDTHAIDLSLSARDLQAVQGDIASAKLNIDLSVTGQDSAYNIKGDVRPDQVDIKLPERFSQSIPQLNIVQKEKGKPAEKLATDILSTIGLDILINAPSQIFVRGWGLDSEFGGAVKIKGFADDPKFDGEFSVIRGRYSEFGKNFKIERGKLIFSGSVPPSPKLDIVTQTKTADILARIEIKGTPQAPKITFSSEPALPEDEVLSHILFGKNMDSITPFQAVKLTQTLQRFSGKGGSFSGFDPLDIVRSATGLDDLRVEADEEGGATVGAGKYLTDNVYLEFETGSEEGSGNANIEIELTPNITVESEIGQDAQGGGGVFWKWDY